MEPQMNQESKNIEAMIEAQLRGEQVDAPTETTPTPQDSELDLRTSKAAQQLDAASSSGGPTVQ